MIKTFYGDKAVAEVEKLEGPLDNIAKEIVHEEGFVTGDYLDDKGISTAGVGQTGKFKGKPFKEVYAFFVKETKRLVPAYDQYPEHVQASLVGLAYRGDLQQSPTFRKLLAQGDYEEAAVELLNHKEYKERKKKSKPDGVVKRLELASERIRAYGKEKV